MIHASAILPSSSFLEVADEIFYRSRKRGRVVIQMGKRLFIGNLPFSIDDQGLGQIFAAVGTVVSAKVITDKFTGRSRGFGFVEMSSDEETDAAITKLNDTEVDGRKIVVNVAKPLEDRPRNDSFGNRGGGGFSRDRGGDRRGGFDRNRGGGGRR